MTATPKFILQTCSLSTRIDGIFSQNCLNKMEFKQRNLRTLAECIIGDNDAFQYRSSYYITEFFEECGLDFSHDGSTRWSWTADRLADLLDEPPIKPGMLPERFVHVFRVLLHPSDALDGDPDRSKALVELNKPLMREGFEVFYDDDKNLQFRNTKTKMTSISISPDRPLSQVEQKNRDLLSKYISSCSEDQLTQKIILPMLKHLGFHRITSAGHRDKALEYGQDVWMRFQLPTTHILYFAMQVKKGKLDSAGASKSSNSNVAEVLNQLTMMLGHPIFDSETSRRVLIDHAIIVASGEITKQAKNWLGEKLDQTKRSQVLFMDKEDILNLYIANSISLPPEAIPPDQPLPDDIPF